MGKVRKNISKSQLYSIRMILGYNCRLVFDPDGECYLISCQKFPELLEDGRDSKEATNRMKCAIRNKISELKKNKEEIPPMDDPDWIKALDLARNARRGEDHAEKRD